MGATRTVPLNFRISDVILFSVKLKLRVEQFTLSNLEEDANRYDPSKPGDLSGVAGVLYQGAPIQQLLPVFEKHGSLLCYAHKQYSHYYIDLRGSFDDYISKFSSKTRSTLKRKVAKFERESGGTLDWRRFKTPDEIRAFFPLARQVAVKTYQEKLFGGGLPDSPEFLERALELAGEARICAYILFSDGKPVSYLYCPAQDGVLSYDYLGYDPDYARQSVGTVLQWLALQDIFESGHYELFDFTEGESSHKKLFATDHDLRANIFCVRNTPRYRLLMGSHYLFNRATEKLGELLDRYGLRQKLRRLLRR